MKFHRTKIPGLIICEMKKIKDNRGIFFESFRKDLLEKYLGKKINICQENISESKFGVLRGLHFQKEPYSQSKIVAVVQGKILDVVVDIRKNSKFYGKTFSMELDENENKQLFIPKGFAHGFVVLSKKAVISYKVDNYYNPKSERGLKYDDPYLKIDWKIDSSLIITSKKDKKYPSFDSNYLD